MNIPLIKPYITQEIKDAVIAVLDSGHLTEGPRVLDLENLTKSFTGAQHAIAVTSCTTGLEVALRALGIGPGDEVIVPDYTYPATADAVAIVGAKIVVVDICKETMLIDYDAIQRAITPATKAVLPVSLFGNPLDFNRLTSIVKPRKIRVIEDAACSLGAQYHGQKVGTFADITVFSLHPRKFITTGEGGLITTNSDEIAQWIHSYKKFGTVTSGSRSSTVFERIGTNLKLSDILAAIGMVQMQHIEELLQHRVAQAEIYTRLLKGQPGIALPHTTTGGLHSYQSYNVFIENRDEVLVALKRKGIEVQIGTYSLHMHPAFQPGPACTLYGSMAASTWVFNHCLALPLYHTLTPDQQTLVAEALTICVNELMTSN
jgi:perosamine synthetase